MTVWIVVGALGAITIAIKASGPVALGRWTPPAWARRVLKLVSPVVLAALIATQVFSSGHHYHVDTKAIGLGVAAIALLFRAPLLVVVICAVASSAGAQALLG